MGPEVSILVPVLNEEEHLVEAVAAMESQNYDGGIEILLIDGGSEDATPELLSTLRLRGEQIRVLSNPNRVTPHALNIGLRAARGEYIVRMDAHCIYPPTYVREGVERLAAGDVAWVSGPQVPTGCGRWSRLVAYALSSPLGRGGSAKWGSAGGAEQVVEDEWDLDTGVFCGVWRRADLEAMGGWDEGWPINQDSELAARFLATGRRIVCRPGMGASYVPRDTVRGLWHQYWRFGFYRAKTARRHPESLRRSHLLAPGLAGAAALALLPRRGGGRLGRQAVALYALAVITASVRSCGVGRDALGLSAVYSVMHLSFGVGFVSGCVRNGPPLRALRHILGGSR